MPARRKNTFSLDPKAQVLYGYKEGLERSLPDLFGCAKQFHTTVIRLWTVPSIHGRLVGGEFSGVER